MAWFGQSVTQQPQYQHSSGCKTTGGLFSSGLGIKTSTWQTSTQWLQPVQTSGLKNTGFAGLMILGKAKVSLRGIAFSLFSFIDSGVVLVVRFIVRFHVAPV